MSDEVVEVKRVDAEKDMVDMYNSGMTIREIADAFHISQPTVSTILKKYKRPGQKLLFFDKRKIIKKQWTVYKRKVGLPCEDFLTEQREKEQEKKIAELLKEEDFVGFDGLPLRNNALRDAVLIWIEQKLRYNELSFEQVKEIKEWGIF